MIQRSMPAVVQLLLGLTLPDRSKESTQRKTDTLVLQFGGWFNGPVPHHSGRGGEHTHMLKNLDKSLGKCKMKASAKIGSSGVQVSDNLERHFETDIYTKWAKSRYTDALLIGCYTVYLLLAHSIYTLTVPQVTKFTNIYTKIQSRPCLCNNYLGKKWCQNGDESQ